MDKTKWYLRRHCEPNLRAKRRGGVAILLALALVLSLGIVALPMAGTAEAVLPPNEVWVCPTGDCGHPGFSYNTIQAAIGVVAPGGTINVAAGTYNESVTINKNNLQLLGAKAGIPAGPEANAANRSLPSEGSIGESIINGKITEPTKVSGSTIAGFTILSAGQNGISLGTRTARVGNVIKNNIIDGGSANIVKAGISSLAGGGYLITNNNIRNYKWGMMFDGSVPVTAPPCEISGNYITNANFAGIVAMASWSNGHTFSYNTIENSGAGIHLGQGEHQVSHNTIVGNTGSGIYILAGPRTFGIQITYNTIEGNATGIELASDDAGAVNNQAHFNNIAGNTNGVLNNHSAEFDAENNWWGNASGPYHPTTNPGGTGNGVSDNVDYDPWLGAELEEVESKTISDSGTMQDTPTGGDITIDATGNHTITTAAYAENPGGACPFTNEGSYYDVHLDSADGVNSLTVQFCPAYENEVIYFWNGAAWVAASNQVYADGCVVVTITDETQPSLSDLTGLPFGQGFLPPVGGEAYPVNKAGLMMPWIALGMAVIAGATVFTRRRKAQG